MIFLKLFKLLFEIDLRFVEKVDLFKVFLTNLFR